MSTAGIAGMHLVGRGCPGRSWTAAGTWRLGMIGELLVGCRAEGTIIGR